MSNLSFLSETARESGGEHRLGDLFKRNGSDKGADRYSAGSGPEEGGSARAS